MNYDEEIKKYEEQAEKAKAAYMQCLGVIQYLKQEKEKSEKEG
tara:strand:+ start:825 stop:953 length:129 start_codon:yes stop_codon:yes gene_type:complete